MTVEQVIQESVKEFKKNQAQARRKHIRKLIDYYCGANTANYISQYFDADAFREYLVMRLILQKDLWIRWAEYIQ